MPPGAADGNGGGIAGHQVGRSLAVAVNPDDADRIAYVVVVFIARVQHREFRVVIQLAPGQVNGPDRLRPAVLVKPDLHVVDRTGPRLLVPVGHHGEADL